MPTALVIVIAVISIIIVLGIILFLDHALRKLKSNRMKSHQEEINKIKSICNNNIIIENKETTNFKIKMINSAQRILAETNIPDKKLLKILKRYEDFLSISASELMESPAPIDELALTTLINLSVSANDAKCSAEFIKYKQNIRKD